MRGLETSQLIGIILVLVVVVIVVIVVFGPALAFGKTTDEKRNFEEFCVFWGINGYKEGLGESVVRSGTTYDVTQMCSAALRSTPDIETCKKCCQKVIVC
jgi:hypothetical protein